MNAPTNEIVGRKITRLIFNLRDLTERTPIHTLAVLGHIAMAGEDGISMRDLAKVSDTPQSTLSRTILFLLDEYKGEPGPGLVEQYLDPSDYRAKFVRLTPKGFKIMDELKETLA